MSVSQNLVIIEDSKPLNKIMKYFGINSEKNRDQTKPAQGTALIRALVNDIDGKPKLLEQSISRGLIDILQILGTDEQQIKFKTGDLKDEERSSFIYDEFDNQIGYILETETKTYKIKKDKKEKKDKFVLNVELMPRITHCHNHWSKGQRKWCKSIHLGNVLVLNINGKKNFYFVIPNSKRTICYCINYLTAQDFFDVLNEYEKVNLELRENIISELRTNKIYLHEITIKDLKVSNTTLDDYESLFNITNTDNSLLNLTNSEVSRINRRLNSSELPSFNPDNVGFGRKKESRKKGRRKAKPAPKGKPMPKDKPKATKKRKKVKRKTK